MERKSVCLDIHFRWLIFEWYSLISLKTIISEILRKDEWRDGDIQPQIICHAYKKVLCVRLLVPFPITFSFPEL